MSRRHHEFGWLIVGVVLAIVCLILLPAALRAIARGDDRPPVAGDGTDFAIFAPVEITEIVDGDTVTCRLTVDMRVRLLDCWAPELRGKTQAEKDKAVASKKHLESVALHKRGGLFVKLAGVERLDDLMSFGRILGRVSVLGVGDLSAKQVDTGHAYRRKLELEQALTPQ